VFNESFDVNEDVELAERIARTGKEAAYAPQVRVRHPRDTTLFSFLRRNFGMAQAGGPAPSSAHAAGRRRAIRSALGRPEFCRLCPYQDRSQDSTVIGCEELRPLGAP
jgi:hypothetical protein